MILENYNFRYEYNNEISIHFIFKTKPGKSTPTRYSILSDPRLSQLFALSSQLEALADSCEMEANSALNSAGRTDALNAKKGRYLE